MQRQSVIEFARVLGLGAPARTSTAVWVHYKCPFARWKHDGKQSKSSHFNISVSTTKHSVYQCWACKSRGALPHLAYELAQLRKEPELVKIGKQIEEIEVIGPKIVLPKWDDEPIGELDETPANDPLVLPRPEREFEFPSAAGHPYLRDRGVSFSTTIRLGIRYDARQRRVLFPVYTPWGQFAGFTGRAVYAAPTTNADGDELEADGITPYLKVRDYFGLRKRRLFLSERTIRAPYPTALHNGTPSLQRLPGKSRITLVEGIFDYAYFTELGISAPWAILGSALTPEKVAILAALGHPVVLFFDNDKAGQDGATLAKVALFGKVPLFEVEYPEGYDGADPGVLPPLVAMKMAANASFVTRL